MKNRFKTRIKLIIFLFGLFICVSACYANEISLEITRNNLLNPGSKNDLWLHIKNHSKVTKRFFSFNNGAPTAIYLVSSSGEPILPMKRVASNSRAGNSVFSKPFNIAPGDVSGCIVKSSKFKQAQTGIYYMIFAIPAPNEKGIIVSPPCKIFIKNNEFESVNSISFDDLPKVVKNTFRCSFEKLMNEEKIPLKFFKLPF